MIDLYHFKGFATVKQDHTFEGMAVYLYCMENDIPVFKANYKDACPEDYVPCGSIPWITKTLNKTIIPDYYPEWMSEHLHRKVWKSDEWIRGEKFFVKPADKHKRFDGFITRGTWHKKKKPPFWYSEIVSFSNEWRYYVTKGKIICGKWYDGDEVNTPDAPELDITIPESFSGTLDFGTFSDGTLALVEAHEPFGCGWYGEKEDETFLQWVIDGWIYMLEK